MRVLGECSGAFVPCHIAMLLPSSCLGQTSKRGGRCWPGQDRRRRNWPLQGHTTILDCLARISRPLLCAAWYGRRMKTHIASICFKCFKCFKGMLQVFHTDVVKVVQDVSHVAMIVHVCCKLMCSQYFICFFRRTLQVCLSRCFICFHTYDVSVLSKCCVCLQ
jgi:hypothetical protein